MSPKVKESRYNIDVPIRGGRRLVFNAVTHRMILAPEDQALEGSDEITALTAAGFLVDQDLEELSGLQAGFDAQRGDRRRLMVTIAPTLYCNLACGYCFQGMNKPSTKMALPVQDQLVERISARIPTLDALTVTWYGGEPLMNQAAIWPISERLMGLSDTHGVQYRASIITNGYLLTLETAQRLVDCRVLAAQITIDGLAETHDKMRPMLSGRGSYDKIMENICAVLDNTPMRISVRVNVDVRNAPQIHALLNEFADRGLGHRNQFSVYFAPIEAITTAVDDGDEHVMTKSSYAELEVELLARAARLGLTSLGGYPKNMGVCQAVRPNDMIVLPTGDLHKCWDTVQDGDKRHATIWDEEVDEQNSAWLAWSPYKSDTCSQCKILPICGGACAFKTVHTEETVGEAGELPCPSLKFNLAERLFLAAKESGLVTAGDWDEARSPTWAAGVGKLGPRHTPESVARFAAIIAEDASSAAEPAAAPKPEPVVTA